MVVDRRHEKDALARPLEADDLDDQREHLDHEDPRDQGEQDLRARDDCEAGDGAAERERARVAHDDLGGEGVVPKEPDRPSDQRGRERGDVEQRVAARARISRAEPRDAGDREEREKHDHDDTGGHPVDPVRQVRAVDRSRDDQEQQDVVARREVERPAGDRHVHLGGEARALVEEESCDDGDHREADHLPATRQPERVAPPQLQVVVREADERAPEHDEQDREPLGRVLREREEREDGGRDDEEAAHGRRALLDDVGCRAFGADLLTEVARAQQLDELRPDDDAGDHRDEAGYQDGDHARAKFAISSAKPSSPTARDAFTRTASPGSM